MSNKITNRKNDYGIHGGNVAALIRSLCGIDRTKAHQKFYEFIRSEQLTAMQEEYLDSILNYVCAHTR